MKKVLVVGSGGSGKSTLARRLGNALGLPVIHLDKLFWKPGWVETEKREWEKRVDEVLEKDCWIIDGNYSGTLAQRVEVCDTVLFLDQPRLLCIYRALKRMVQYRGQVRPDMAPGCPERLNLKFLFWIWSYPTRSRAKVLRQIEHQRRDNLDFVHLRSFADVEQFVKGIERAQGRSPNSCHKNNVNGY